VNITEYDFLLQNGIVNSVELKYSLYYNYENFWAEQSNETMKLYLSPYPRWDYDNCDREGYHARDFKDFIDKMGALDEMAAGIALAQYLVCILSIVFFIFALGILPIIRQMRTPSTLSFFYNIKFFFTIIFNIGGLLFTLLIFQSSKNIDADDVAFYKDNVCVAEYVTYQMEKFEVFYSDSELNMLILATIALVQVIYELYSFFAIKCKCIFCCCCKMENVLPEGDVIEAGDKVKSFGNKIAGLLPEEIADPKAAIQAKLDEAKEGAIGDAKALFSGPI